MSEGIPQRCSSPNYFNVNRRGGTSVSQNDSMTSQAGRRIMQTHCGRAWKALIQVGSAVIISLAVTVAREGICTCEESRMSCLKRFESDDPVLPSNLVTPLSMYLFSDTIREATRGVYSASASCAFHVSSLTFPILISR